MMAFEAAMRMAQEGQLPPGPTRKMFDIAPFVQDSHRRAIRAGVRIALGTDAGVFTHGTNAREFELLVQAGLSPQEALLAATRNAADALGRSAELGTLERGKRADLVAVLGDPLQDVRVLQDIGFVMKGGVVYKQQGAPMP
jgi:imidazolonepropionase-like amidohydrolase